MTVRRFYFLMMTQQLPRFFITSMPSNSLRIAASSNSIRFTRSRSQLHLAGGPQQHSLHSLCGLQAHSFWGLHEQGGVGSAGVQQQSLCVPHAHALPAGLQQHGSGIGLQSGLGLQSDLSPHP
jgi:hypothetical protein